MIELHVLYTVQCVRNSGIISIEASLNNDKS